MVKQNTNLLRAFTKDRNLIPKQRILSNELTGVSQVRVAAYASLVIGKKKNQ